MRCDKALKRLEKRRERERESVKKREERERGGESERDIPLRERTHGLTHRPSAHSLVAAVAVIAVAALGSLLLRYATAAEWRISR